ncbi:MAG: hypothetical protein ACXVCF_00145 [Isosphaeraceae bacterium]
MGNPDPSPETRFKPGESGNPSGSSRKARLTARLLQLFDDMAADGPFLQVGLKAALEGDFRFWSYLFDRIDGRIEPAEQGPAIDLEAVARAMSAKYESIRPDGPESVEREA